ncbi:MAG: hypothetical protein FD130_1919, partial [Halothiobacillaceae bacterium]
EYETGQIICYNSGQFICSQQLVLWYFW